MNMPTSISELVNDNVCASGGADGADLLFSFLAKRAGHVVEQFTFLGQKYHGDPLDRIVLSTFHLSRADPTIKRANAILRRKYPTRSPYVNNLIRRNFYQVLNAERIYCTQTITDGLVNGGTGFTITMGILMGVKEIYIFETAENVWKRWEGDLTGERKWTIMDSMIKPYGKYAGIGARDITTKAVDAITELYGV